MSDVDATGVPILNGRNTCEKSGFLYLFKSPRIFALIDDPVEESFEVLLEADGNDGGANV